MFGELITEEILYPVPHRQYGFTIPKMRRPYFRFDRKPLGKLSKCAYRSLKEFFRTTLNRREGVPGAVISIQTFGDLVNNKGEQSVRYYGAYSNASRGRRKQEKIEKEPAEVTQPPPPLVSKEIKRRWFYFICKVYEIDPLVCHKWVQALPQRRSKSGCRFRLRKALNSSRACSNAIQ